MSQPNVPTACYVSFQEIKLMCNCFGHLWVCWKGFYKIAAFRDHIGKEQLYPPSPHTVQYGEVSEVLA